MSWQYELLIAYWVVQLAVTAAEAGAEVTIWWNPLRFLYDLACTAFVLAMLFTGGEVDSARLWFVVVMACLGLVTSAYLCAARETYMVTVMAFITQTLFTCVYIWAVATG